MPVRQRSSALMRRRRIGLVGAIVGFAFLIGGLLAAPSQIAQADAVTTDNACSNNVQPTPPSVIPMVLQGVTPASASKGSAFTVTGLKITAQVPAAFIQTGINLGLLKDGQSVTGTITVKIHAVNATPADLVVSGNGSGVVDAPGTPPVAKPLTVLVNLPNKAWTPTAVGPVTLAQAKTGAQAASPAIVTDGSIQVDAHIGALTVKIICKPGTVTGTAVTPAASVSPFVSVDAGEPVATSSTTTTTSSTTTTTSSSSSTTSTTTGSSSTTTTTTPHTPKIQLSSTLNLNAGDPLTVGGTGFSPYASVAVMECGPKFLTAKHPEDECDVDKAITTSTDVGGGFTATMPVLESGAAAPNDFVAADASAKCPPPQISGATSCMVVARNTEVASETAVMPISFNVPGATTSSTTTTQQVAQVVQLPASGGGSGGGGGGSVASGGTTAGGTTTELASTGPMHHTGVLLGLGILLLDLGYLSLSAARPGRRLRALHIEAGR